MLIIEVIIALLKSQRNFGAYSEGCVHTDFVFFSGDSLHIPPVERSYKAKTLVHYPENVSWNPFDEQAVCMVGLFFVVQSHMKISQLETCLQPI